MQGIRNVLERMMKFIIIIILIAQMCAGSEKETIGRIYLVRHLQKDQTNRPHTEFENYKWRIALDAKDFKKKKYFTELFRKNLHKHKTPLIYVSPFKRTIESALPIAEALGAKIRIEKSLFEPFHGFPSDMEIKSFYKGYEDYVDMEYKGKIFGDFLNDYYSRRRNMFDFINPENYNKVECIEQMYELHGIIAKYFKEEQQKNIDRDIIVVSHQREMHEIGLLLQDPEREREEDHVLRIMETYKMRTKWYHGTVVEFENWGDRYVENRSWQRSAREGRYKENGLIPTEGSITTDYLEFMKI